MLGPSASLPHSLTSAAPPALLGEPAAIAQGSPARQGCPQRWKRGGASLCALLQAGNATVPSEGIFSPPYTINNGNRQYALGFQTMSPAASHFDGSLEYDVHNLYGLYFTKVAYQGLQTLRQKRPFILTRCAAVSGDVLQLGRRAACCMRLPGGARANLLLCSSLRTCAGAGPPGWARGRTRRTGRGTPSAPGRTCSGPSLRSSTRWASSL